MAFRPQVLKDFTAKTNGQNELSFLRALTNLKNVFLKRRPYFLGVKLIALKTPGGGLRLTGPGKIFRRLIGNCAVYHVSNYVKQDTEVDKYVLESKGRLVSLRCFPLFD